MCLPKFLEDFASHLMLKCLVPLFRLHLALEIGETTPLYCIFFLFHLLGVSRWTLLVGFRKITDKRKINEIKSLVCVTYFACKVLLDDLILPTVSLKSKLQRYPEMQLYFRFLVVVAMVPDGYSHNYSTTGVAIIWSYWLTPFFTIRWELLLRLLRTDIWTRR